MDDSASTQLRRKVHRINRDRLSATPSLLDTSRVETQHPISQLVVPFGKAVMVFSPRPIEGTSNISSTNVLLDRSLASVPNTIEVVKISFP